MQVTEGLGYRQLEELYANFQNLEEKCLNPGNLTIVLYIYVVLGGENYHGNASLTNNTVCGKPL